MAHNLNFNEQTGKASFFSVQQKAWHGLGQIIQEYPTSAEAIQHAGLDYEVVKNPIYTSMPTTRATESGIQTLSSEIIVPDKYATIRTDNNAVLGLVGKDYEIVQNRDAFTFFDEIVASANVQYETAGALGKGERIFITAKLPGVIRVGEDDVTEQYLFLTTSHDGSGCITIAYTPIRIVCQNTLSAALNCKTNTIKIRHTANAKENFENARKVLGLSSRLSEELEGTFNRWANIKITDRQVRQLIEIAMAPNKETLKNLKDGNKDELSSMYTNACDNVFSYAMLNESQQLETTKGTLFGAYNAVTGYYQNVKRYGSAEEKLDSLLFNGTAQKRTQTAFDLCTAFGQYGAEALQLN
ncbi:DUF932 domain-containing protein [Pedobacter frigoris]|uniref:DUF932 domain-containing protein n=1 Tax=Pedobacter frigoris TaxID=2571272 RepID=UPI00292EE064|nr:DUF932 domain-containing protein [Pedobacter frigoris]